MSPISVTLLGTGSPLPDANRAGPSTLITAGSSHYLVDAGRGVLMRLAGAGVAATRLTAVLVTHLHSDHITDLTDVITTRWVMSFAPTPLTVVGPPGTAAVVDHILASLGPDIGYRMAHHADLAYRPPVEVVEVDDGPVDVAGEATVTCAPTDHKPVHPSIGFRFDHGGGGRRHRAMCWPRPPLWRGRCLGAHRHPQGHHLGHRDPAACGHPRLPLVGGGGSPDGQPQRRRNPCADPLRAGLPARWRGGLANLGCHALLGSDRAGRRSAPGRCRADLTHPSPTHRGTRPEETEPWT